MKKSMIALMGLFMLVACSEDAYQEADKMSETGNVENNSGGMQANSVDPAIPYESPYDLSAGTCCSAVEYVFINNTHLDFEFEPIIGLARFDGSYTDNKHFGWPLTPTSDYPNVLGNEGAEYLKLIYCNPIQVPPFSTYNPGPSGQLPVPSLFSIATPTTWKEQGLLYEFGKVYSIRASIVDTAANQLLAFSMLRFPFLPPGITDPNQLSNAWSPMPSIGPSTDDFFFHKQTREICAGSDYANNWYQEGGLNATPSEETYTHNGRSYVLKLSTTPTQVIISLNEI